jgi:hypothetical protein
MQCPFIPYYGPLSAKDTCGRIWPDSGGTDWLFSDADRVLAFLKRATHDSPPLTLT